MQKVGKKLFLLSFILAVLASGTVFMYLQSLDKNKVEIEKTTILVAAQTIPPRTIIEKRMIKQIEVPIDSAYGDFIENIEKLVGKYSKETILKDERFHKAKLINELEEELSLKIKGNNRAVSIHVNGESGITDLMKAGDFVDVIVYLPEIKESQRIVRPDMTKMMLQNIEVLAIDKNLYRHTEAGKEIPPTFFVTLSVSVFDVEKIALAEDIGNLKLALRPMDGDYIHETEGTIWQELLLDDFYRMKDMSPQYEVRPVPASEAEDEEEQYDKYYYYIVKYGDTLRKISKEFYGDPRKYILIKQVNRIDDENKIMVGTGLKIPMLQGKKGKK